MSEFDGSTSAAALPVSSAEDKTLRQADLRLWQEQLLRGVLLAAAIVGLFVAAAGTYDAYVYGQIWIIPLFWGAYSSVVVLFLWKRAPYALRAGAIVSIVYVLGFTQLIEDGTGGSVQVFLLSVPFLAGIFFGRGASVAALFLVTGTMAGFGGAFSLGMLTIPENPTTAEPARWVAGTLALFLMGVLMVVSLDYLISRLATALGQSRSLVRSLDEQRGNLEEQVTERTTDLARRSAQLEAAAVVAREAARIRDVEQLLVETANLISERFGFYHTGLFLLDEAGEYAVLRAASSEGGRRMLAKGHRLRVGREGIVGHVTGAKQARIALDVGEDAAFFDNPDLPRTRSEIALPLMVGDDVLGALDVQSTERQAFGQQDVTVLQTMADQVAIAISNARLVRRVQESLETERRTYGQMTLEAWRSLIRTELGSGRRYDPQRLLPRDSILGESTAEAMREGRAVAGKDAPGATMALPLKVRGQVIGVLDAYKPAETGEWREEEVSLFQALVDQLGIALESARLYQDAQRRALEDRLVGEVTARLRATMDVDTVLQTAVREMGSALAIDKVELRLRSPQAGDGQDSLLAGQARGPKEEDGHGSLD
jgi:GAF domain-containing protein